MKHILTYILLLFTLTISAQEVEQIVPADVVTGSNTGDAEIKEAFRRFNTTDVLIRLWINKNKALFNWGDSSIVMINHIYFNLEEGGDLEEGQMKWDSIDKTLSVGLDAGSSGQMFQELHMRSTNKTGDTIYDGKIVYVNGAQGNRPTIELASDTSISAILTLGPTTQDILNNKTGYVALVGLVRGIDTRDFIPGAPLWLGTEPGTLTNTRPPAPNTSVTLGVAINSTEDGTIATRPVVVQRLSWLSDVDARGNQTNWDMLYWDEDSAKWDLTNGTLNLPSVPTYADNAAALFGGLVAGDLYKTTTGDVMIVY